MPRVRLPRLPTTEKRYLDHDQVDALATACGSDYGPLVMTLAYTGIRWGEAAALTVGRVDLKARRIAIVDNLPVGDSEVTSPKSHQTRVVPIPGVLREVLMPLLADKTADDSVFTGPAGTGRLQYQNFRRRAFDDAAASIDLAGLVPHELRHTAASLAIASGADVKVVQQMLGHASATMTLDLYGHLFGDRLDEVADAMDAAALRARAEQRRSNGGAGVVDLASRRAQKGL